MENFTLHYTTTKSRKQGRSGYKHQQEENRYQKNIDDHSIAKQIQNDDI